MFRRGEAEGGFICLHCYSLSFRSRRSSCFFLQSRAIAKIHLPQLLAEIQKQLLTVLHSVLLQHSFLVTTTFSSDQVSTDYNLHQDSWTMRLQIYMLTLYHSQCAYVTV